MRDGRRRFLAGLPLLPAVASNTAKGSSSGAAQDFLGEIERIPVVDTHEHIIPESERIAQTVDFFTLAGHYALNDVISAGLPPEAQKTVRDPEAPQRQRWAAFEPWWRHAQFTGYGQALRIAVRDVYGFEEISAATLPRIDAAIRENNRPGLYGRILRDRAGIRYAVLDDYWNAAPVKPESDLFVLARKFDRFVTPATAGDVRDLEELTGVSINSLAGLKQAMERSFEQSLEAGMATVKSTMAYARDLRFEEVEETTAAAAFDSLMKGDRKLPEGFRRYVSRPFRSLEDHMFHHLIRLADAHRVPVQIHTGLLAGNGNFITNTQPTHLTNLFFLYPRVPFDLFHIGYPYTSELASLAKLFPNVHIDFCWAHIISPSVARRALHEYLETVPVNKIFGYGGDYRFPELSYAHLVMARRNVAQVLREKIAEGFCGEQQALEIARLLLHENPARMFPAGRNRENA